MPLLKLDIRKGQDLPLLNLDIKKGQDLTLALILILTKVKALWKIT